MPPKRTFKQTIIIKQKNLKKLLDLIVVLHIVKYRSSSMACINSRTLVIALFLLVEYLFLSVFIRLFSLFNLILLI